MTTEADQGREEKKGLLGTLAAPGTETSDGAFDDVMAEVSDAMVELDAVLEPSRHD